MSLRNNPSAAALDENIIFVHRTFVLPLHGTLVPGCQPAYRGHPLDDKIVRSKSSDVRKIYAESNEHVPNKRMTIHWFPNAVVESHQYYSARSHYVVVERAKNLKPQLFGGYAEDFFSIGPYTLSSESVILVPTEHLEDARAELHGYVGTIRSYDRSESLSAIVQEIVCSMSAWRLVIPQSQKYTVSLTLVQAAMLLATVDVYGPDYKDISRAMSAARRAGKNQFDYEFYLPPDKLMVNCDGVEQLAADFFSAWSQSGLYAGLADASLPFEFDKLYSKATFSLYAIFCDAGQILKRQQRTSLEGIETPGIGSLIPDANELRVNIDLTVKALKAIQQELARRQFPSAVIDYVNDEFDVNGKLYWLQLMTEIQRDLPSKKSLLHNLPAYEQRRRQLAAALAVMPDGESEQAIDEQSTATLMNDYLREQGSALEFKAGRNRHSTYVFARLTFNVDVQTKAPANLYSLLLRHGIGHCVFFKPATQQQVGELLVTRINAPSVARPIRVAMQESLAEAGVKYRLAM